MPSTKPTSLQSIHSDSIQAKPLKNHLLRSSLLLLSLTSFSHFSYANVDSASAKPKTITAAKSVTSAQVKAEKSFKALYDKVAAYEKKEFGARGNNSSDEEGDLDFTESGDATQKRRLAYWRGIANEIGQLDKAHLSSESQINLRIFSDQITNRISNIQYDAYLIPFNSDSQFWASTSGMGQSTRCTTATNCEQLIRQFAGIERTFNEKIALMKLGIQRGMTLPQVVLTGRDASIALHVVDAPEKSVFFNAFTQLPASMSEDQKNALQTKARTVIADKVIPAYRHLLQFIQNEYIPQARKTIAASDLPNGKAYYQSQIFEYTTLDLTPDQIHAIGLSEVARIRSDMMKIISDLQFKGDFPAFLHFLRTDPQFYAKTPHELLAEASYLAKRADGMLPLFFGRLPRKPYGIAPVPADLAPTYTTGRYAGSSDPKRPSYYWVNTSLLDQRPMWALPALTLHESVPGHHLQIALSGEQHDQPEFRRKAYISAFGEGWGLYAEHLGVEMGFYETPYQNFGRLVYEMWRAARLVVDTGMHAKGWTRDQALQFMRENTALSEHEITTEIDRYISWPAQALSYKLGELKIREMRTKAEKELGEQFDVRAFHDHLLSLGSVPLSILDSEMTAWINQEKTQTKSATHHK